MSTEDSIYRVHFYQDDHVYEVYAKSVSEECIVGFIMIEELVFENARSSVVIDPTEENLRAEFKGVKRCYIPVHSVIRIDEVKHCGVAKIRDKKSGASNVAPFPSQHFGQDFQES